jgi:hypothetical protein
MSMRVRERRTVGLFAVLAIVLAACSSGSAATTAPTTGTMPTPSASASSAAASPAQTLEPSPSLAVLPSGGRVPRGTYATLFEPAMTLTLDLPAESNVDIAGWVDLTFEGDPSFDMHIIRVDKLFDPTHPTNLVDPPGDLAAWFTNHPGVTAVNPVRDVQVGQLAATRLDLRTGSKEVAFGPITGADDPAQFPDHPNFGAGPDQTIRLTIVAVEGRIVVFYGGVQESGQAHFDADMAALEPLLRSVVWP